MSVPAARVLAALDLLQTHGWMRGEELAARLEVDVRTVRRYVMTLREQGMPIEMARGRYGGYRLRPGFKFPLALTEPEALSVVFGLLSMRQQDDRAAGESAQALAKVTHALARPTRELMRDLQEAVTFAMPLGGAPESGALAALKTVARAVKERQRLRLRYQAWGGAVSERVVDPYQVVYRYGKWYLVAYCHLRAGERVFRIERILDAAPLAGTFDSLEIDALAAVERAIARVPWRWEYQVDLGLALEEAHRRIPATIAELEQGEQGVVMRGFADDLAWIASLLAGLRCRVAVLYPPELRAELLALAEHARSLAAQPEVSSM